MADTAAFFAKKKKGKKKFSFNANNIDANTVTKADHVDAPAITTGHEGSMANLSLQSNQNDPAGGTGADKQASSGEQWDDEALAATLNRKAAAHAPGNVLDMKALDPRKGNEQDNIAEKLRVEENKAKLAAAREGMEREAQRIKEEQEKKKEAAAGSRFGAAAANTPGAAGSKWVPPHMRAGALPKIRMGAAAGGMPQKVDTQNEELFPDLTKADEIIEQQQKQQQPLYKAKKTPVGGGATWASKPKIKKPEPPKKEEEPAPEPSPAAAPAPPPAEAGTSENETPANTATKETTPPAAAKTANKPLVKKKKKKDLSTFKG